MRRLNPLPAFRDSRKRPRMIMWLGVLSILFVVVWAVAIDGTSTYWFCTTPCHIVHDDNTLAYNESSHTNVACVACHEPVNASGLTMTMKKIEVAPDAITTAFRTFELPMNHDNHVAQEMPAAQCVQCHDLGTRKINTSAGIIIDHEAHAQKGIQCTLCHNRVAHPEENIKLVLEGDRKHDNWLTMDACFRCHGQTAEAKAPGACGTCHPANFDLKPRSHDASGWVNQYSLTGGHAKAAKAESATIAANIAFFKKRPPEEPSHGEIEGKEPRGELKPSAQINSCYTCHVGSFCDDCHKTQIPHPASFKKNHSQAAYADTSVCAQCHARNASEAKGTGSCNACHHPASTPDKPWVSSHPAVVRAQGTRECFKCHDPRYCSVCHVEGPQSAAEFAAKQRAAGK